MKIDPRRLRTLREGQRLSRESLEASADVSARQIARIELSGEPATVRKRTAENLAEALGVTVAMLAGEESPGENGRDQPGHGEKTDRQSARRGKGKGTSTHVDVPAEVLQIARKWRGLSRRALAEESGVSERQIARMESSDAPTCVRRATAERLARVLDIQIEEQSLGETLQVPYDLLFGPIHALKQAAPQMMLGARVSPQVRLAYDLVNERYGASVRDIVVLAPLLFVLLAEGSLKWRHSKLMAVCEALEHLNSFGQSDPHLYFTKYTANVDDGYFLEEESIRKADVTGTMLREDSFVREYEYGDVHPFQDYLESRMARLESADIADFNRGDRITPDRYWGIAPYRLFPERLAALTGGSDYARWAVEYGDVRISEIPKELMDESATKKRVAWLESRLSNDVRALMETSGTLMDALLRKKRVGDEQSDHADQ